jgi:hypothetical protein
VKISTFNYPFSTPNFGAKLQAYVAGTLHGKYSAKYGHLTGAPVSKTFTRLDLTCSAALARLRLNNSQFQSEAELAGYSPSFDGGSVQQGVAC